MPGVTIFGKHIQISEDLHLATTHPLSPMTEPVPLGTPKLLTYLLQPKGLSYKGSLYMQIRELVVEYAEARVSDVRLKRGLADLSLTFLRGSIFGHPSLPVMGRFDRIHVGANCPKSRLRDLLRLLKPGNLPFSPFPLGTLRVTFY